MTKTFKPDYSCVETTVPREQFIIDPSKYLGRQKFRSPNGEAIDVLKRPASDYLEAVMKAVAAVPVPEGLEVDDRDGYMVRPVLDKFGMKLVIYVYSTDRKEVES